MLSKIVFDIIDEIGNRIQNLFLFEPEEEKDYHTIINSEIWPYFNKLHDRIKAELERYKTDLIDLDSLEKQKNKLDSLLLILKKHYEKKAIFGDLHTLCIEMIINSILYELESYRDFVEYLSGILDVEFKTSVELEFEEEREDL